MGKNIVIFSDGTGQEGGVGPETNVYKLYKMVLDRTTEQIAFYDRGLGTDRGKFAEALGGFGIFDNVRACYEFVSGNFLADDKIFLFGFSRGAYTVRLLADFIHLFGILPKSRTDKVIRQAYAIYKTPNPVRRDERARNFIKKRRSMWTRIKFLGVWDTVGALGLPIRSLDALFSRIPGFKYKFHNLRLSPSVENAFQALAIDEQRLYFYPMIWDSSTLPHQTMKQVWFCGVHSDVGGGYGEHELSDISLSWMVKQATEQGLRIYPHHEITFACDPNGFMHDSFRGVYRGFYLAKGRDWNSAIYGKPIVHESVKDRVKNHRNEKSPRYSPWILNRDHEVEPY